MGVGGAGLSLEEGGYATALGEERELHPPTTPMADKLRLGPEIRELKIGTSFLNNRTAFHTLRYDFKPASVVSSSKHASVEVGANAEVTVTHHEAVGAPQTVFKGSTRPCQKECVLIIDRATGQVTLEKLSTNIQLKKTRQEGPRVLNNCNRPPTPVEKRPSPPQTGVGGGVKGGGAKGGVGRGSLVPARHSPLHSSPSYPHRSPITTIHKSPPSLPTLSLSASPVGGSLPMIGLDDTNDNSTNSFDITNTLPEIKSSPDFSNINFNEDDNGLPEVGILSDSSSDSSSESNSSDSESDSKSPRKPQINGHVNGKSSPPVGGMPEQLLNEDLQLSESGSDSD